MSFVSRNPATGAIIARHRAHRPAEIEAALARAHAATLAWRELDLGARAGHLQALAAQLRRERDPLAALITAEMGKPRREARLEIEKCAAACAYYAEQGPRLLRPVRPPGAPREARVRLEPLGVGLHIMPWNFPFWQVFRALAPSLLLGNTALLKHASNVCGCARAIEDILPRAGLPTGLLHSLFVKADTVAGLIADPRVRFVTLTGSTAAGQKVGALAGAALKPAVFELGGADSYIVLADADLDHAVATLVQARLINGGQSCISAKRLIVVEAVREAFERQLLAAFRRIRTGDPRRLNTRLGPLARADLRRELHDQVTRAVRGGARLLLGGKLPAGPGYFYPPTVLADVRPGSPAYAEELFGPVAVIIPARDEAEAIRLANDTPYGLGAGVFTRDRRRGAEIAAHELDAGMACVNDFVRSSPQLPFGGTKQSGYGRELGFEGLQALANIKTVIVR
jgi:succinate-semialdehyde dehydrogenase/glutarate-semialdehyde dehydrogenase